GGQPRGVRHQRLPQPGPAGASLRAGVRGQPASAQAAVGAGDASAAVAAGTRADCQGGQDPPLSGDGGRQEGLDGLTRGEQSQYQAVTPSGVSSWKICAANKDLDR